MSNAKMFIGILMFYVLAQVVCNFIDGNAMYTSTNVADLNGATASSITSSTDSSGTPAQYVSMSTSFFDTIIKVAFFDYTIFRNPDGTANDLVIIRYLMICIGIVMIIELAVVFRQIIGG